MSEWTVDTGHCHWDSEETEPDTGTEDIKGLRADDDEEEVLVLIL